MIFGPEALLELREDMIAISSLSVGCRNIVLLVSFERIWKMFIWIFYAFFCRGAISESFWERVGSNKKLLISNIIDH